MGPIGARADQALVIKRHGGRDAVIKRGAFDNSPVPGEQPKFHLLPLRAGYRSRRRARY